LVVTMTEARFEELADEMERKLATGLGKYVHPDQKFGGAP